MAQPGWLKDLMESSGDSTEDKKITTPEVTTMIILGAFDNDLDLLERTIHNRRMSMGFSLKRGDRVTCSGLRPNYINGIPAVVQHVNRTTASVIFEGDAGRFTGNRGVRVPLTSLKKIG